MECEAGFTLLNRGTGITMISDCSAEKGNPKTVASANPGCDGSKLAMICSFVIFLRLKDVKIERLKDLKR